MSVCDETLTVETLLVGLFFISNFFLQMMVIQVCHQENRYLFRNSQCFDVKFTLSTRFTVVSVHSSEAETKFKTNSERGGSSTQ